MPHGRDRSSSESSGGFPDVHVVYHDPKFKSAVFRVFSKGMGPCLIVTVTVGFCSD